MADTSHRRHAGPPESFDIIGALQFALLTCQLGMRENHYLLDIGCGPLRGGRFFIPYLQAGHYYAIEPVTEMVEAGIREEVGADMIALRSPVFSPDDSFRLTAFGRQFDFIMAQSIFSHAARWQVERCLDEASRVMGPDSAFAATYFPGTSSNENDVFVGGAVSYRPDDMAAMAAHAGLSCVPYDWPHPAQKWLIFRRH